MIQSRIIKKLTFFVDIFNKGNLVVHKDYKLVVHVCGPGMNNNCFKGQVVYSEGGDYELGDYADDWYKKFFIQFEDNIHMSYKKEKYENLFQKGNLVITHDFNTIICVSGYKSHLNELQGVTVNGLTKIDDKQFWERGFYKDSWNEQAFKQFTGSLVLKPLKLQYS